MEFDEHLRLDLSSAGLHGILPQFAAISDLVPLSVLAIYLEARRDDAEDNEHNAKFRVILALFDPFLQA
jgi:hypothetical protein